MPQPFKAACIQNSAGPEIGPSLAEATELVRAAHAKGAEFICLPEYFSCLKASDDQFVVGALAEAEHPALPHYRALAKELGVWLLLGSLAIKADADRVFNRSYMIGANGEIAARYDKIHMFDVDLADGESYRESAYIEPGNEAALAPTPWGSLGMTVCYDLRFPQLYRALAQAGASYLAVPAAFTKTTGEAHWHLLLRARHRDRVLCLRALPVRHARRRAADLWPFADRRPLGPGAGRRRRGRRVHHRRDRPGRGRKSARHDPVARARPGLRRARRGRARDRRA